MQMRKLRLRIHVPGAHNKGEAGAVFTALQNLTRAHTHKKILKIHNILKTIV